MNSGKAQAAVEAKILETDAGGELARLRVTCTGYTGDTLGREPGTRCH